MAIADRSFLGAACALRLPAGEARGARSQFSVVDLKSYALRFATED